MSDLDTDIIEYVPVTLKVAAGLISPFRFDLETPLTYRDFFINGKTSRRTLVLSNPRNAIVKRIERVTIVNQDAPNKLALFDSIVGQFNKDKLELSKMLLNMLADSELVTLAEKENEQQPYRCT